jgi:hypothetical protein
VNTLSELKRKFRSVWPHLDDRTRRIMAANEAVSLGYGGVSLVRRACSLSRKAIAKGIGEIQGKSRPLMGREPMPPLMNDGEKLNGESDEYMQNIITLGGSALGKSSMMPPYGKTLSAAEITDVIAFARVIAQPV